MPPATAFLKARAQAVKTTLSTLPAKDKAEKRVTRQMADEFNSLVEEIGRAYPDAAQHLPKRITSTGPMIARQMGHTDATYADLEIMAETVLQILGVIESHS
jgi:hypothetical protein